MAGLHFWADVTTQGKILSKVFQRDHVLISDVTAGVEDSESAVRALATNPGVWMRAFMQDYDAAKLALDGIELHSSNEGKTEYDDELATVCARIGDHINARFLTLLSCPVLKAAVAFEHARWPGFVSSRPALETHGDDSARARPPRPPPHEPSVHTSLHTSVHTSHRTILHTSHRTSPHTSPHTSQDSALASTPAFTPATTLAFTPATTHEPPHKPPH